MPRRTTSATETTAVETATEIKTVSSYRTPDGIFHATMAEAEAHLRQQEFQEAARSYILKNEDRYKNSASKTRALKVVTHYLEWAAINEADSK